MNRLIIIVEGYSEAEFVEEVMAPYLREFGIFDIRAIPIQTSKGHKGGFVNYVHLKNNVIRILQREKEVVVTTFVDFFRLPKKYIPRQVECYKLNSSDAIIECLEGAMDADIEDQRFFSYLQKHEFEALLFSSNKGFEYYYPPNVSDTTRLIVNEFENPEDINTSPQGAPSKRLLQILPAYNKKVFGSLIALEIGIETILQRCPRFAAWTKKIIAKTVSP